MEEFLKVKEVAALLRVSNMTVYRMIEHGELRSQRVRRSVRIPREAVSEMLAATRKMEEQ